MLSTNLDLLKQLGDNVIHPSAIVQNSELSHCSISEGCHIENSKLYNVIMLPGGRVVHQNLANIIIGFDECMENQTLSDSIDPSPKYNGRWRILGPDPMDCPTINCSRSLNSLEHRFFTSDKVMEAVSSKINPPSSSSEICNWPGSSP